jgi:hypothetical protein
MVRFKTLMRHAVLGAAFIVLTSWAALYVAPEMGRQFANSPTTSQSVYEGLTVATDGESDPQDDGAKIVIKAQTTAEIGELVRFDVSASRAEAFKWILVPESVDFEVYNDGRRATFSAREDGEYMFIVACAYESTVDVKTHIVVVGNPGPKPDDYPRVPRPDSEAALGEWVPYWCALTLRPEEDALKLAESFDGVAATIAAGVNTTPAEIIKATGDSNRQALGDSVEDWKPFLLSLQNEFKKRAAAGTLVSPDQHAEMWREIATGLRAYADLFEGEEIEK